LLFPGPKADVYIDNHGLDAAQDENLDVNGVRSILKNASGKYNEFKYQGPLGNQIGWYDLRSRIFVSAIVADDGDLYITTLFKQSREAVDVLIKRGWK
jgi:hypothetical protein